MTDDCLALIVDLLYSMLYTHSNTECWLAEPSRKERQLQMVLPTIVAIYSCWVPNEMLQATQLQTVSAAQTRIAVGASALCKQSGSESDGRSYQPVVERISSVPSIRGAFVDLKKVNTTFVTSFCRAAWNSAPEGRIFTKFDI